MFQYAAARTLAELRGAHLVVVGDRLDWHNTLGYLGQVLNVNLDGFNSINAELGREFPYAQQSTIGILAQAAGEKLRRLLFSRTFSPRHSTHASGADFEAFDPRFFQLQRGTLLEGYFQSERYFALNSSHVRDWFQISGSEKARLQSVISSWPAHPEQMVAIHVRRGDYLSQKRPECHPELGWALPEKYYENALSALPNGLHFAVFSDDAEYATRRFSSLRPWVSVGSTGVQDLALMSSCRYMIIANSTLSWWAAWLNRVPNKIVLAPKFHVGWQIEWFPECIEVPGWTYVSAT